MFGKREYITDMANKRWVRMWLKVRPQPRPRPYHAAPIFFLHATSEQGFISILSSERPCLLAGPSTKPWGNYVHGLGVLCAWDDSLTEQHNKTHMAQMLSNFHGSSKFACGTLMEVSTALRHERASCTEEPHVVQPGVMVSTTNSHRPPAVKWAIHEADAVVTSILVCLDWNGWV
jgi:hypothetical protein